MATREQLNDELIAFGESALLIDDFDEACIGFTQRINEPLLAVYSYNQMVALLIERDGMDTTEAEEFVEFNCIGAWLGERTPLIVRELNL